MLPSVSRWTVSYTHLDVYKRQEAKPSEIAERMGITEEEVRELMKVSLDAIAVLDQSK